MFPQPLSKYTQPRAQDVFAALKMTVTGLQIFTQSPRYTWMNAKVFRPHEEIFDLRTGKYFSLVGLVMQEKKCSESEAWEWLQKNKIVSRIFLIHFPTISYETR